MTDLHYIYGQMGSGKTSRAFKIINEFESLGKKVLVMKTTLDTRDFGKLVSRTGEQKECVLFDKETNLYEFYNSLHKNYDLVIIDECEFLTAMQVDQLALLSNNIKVICFGTILNYNGQYFEGTKRLTEVANTKEEIVSKCKCGLNAELNARIVNGKIFVDKTGICIGDIGDYEPMCLSCWRKKLSAQHNNE